MIARVKTSNDKVYNLSIYLRINDKYINELKKEFPNIGDLTVSRNGMLFLLWPDPDKDNYSFLKQLGKKDVRFNITFETVKEYSGGELMDVNFSEVIGRNYVSNNQENESS